MATKVDSVNPWCIHRAASDESRARTSRRRRALRAQTQPRRLAELDGEALQRTGHLRLGAADLEYGGHPHAERDVAPPAQQWGEARVAGLGSLEPGEVSKSGAADMFGDVGLVVCRR